MSDRAPVRLARLAGLVLHIGSQAFRHQYGAAIVTDFAAMLASERAARGRLAMLRLWATGLVDLMRALWRDRRGAPRGSGVLTGLRGDLTFAARGWRRSPGFTATILLSLSLGLGLAAAIFSFADGYLFRPLPFPDSEQLYWVRDPKGKIARSLTAEDAAKLRQTDAAAFGLVEWNVAHRLPGDEMLTGDRPASVFSYEVSPGFAQTLRLPLAAGRPFEAADHSLAGDVPAWITDRFWSRAFNRDLAILGRSFKVQGRKPVSVIVVGIIGPGFASLDLNNPPPDLVVPGLVEAVPQPNSLSFPIVRLPDGMIREEGEARISAALQSVAPAPPGDTRVVQLRPLRDSLVANGQPTARLLFAGAMLILLLVSINLMHLLLAQGIRRASEVTTRAALGASRWRIARLFALESALLGAFGIGAGLLLGWWLSALIATGVPEYPSGGRNLALVPMLFDGRVVAFAVILGLVIALVGAAWPAWRAVRGPLQITARTAAGLSPAGSVRTSRIVLASELAVATVIMLGTVFVGVGIHRYLNQPLGFDYRDRLWLSVTPPDGSSAEQRQELQRTLRQLTARVAGVRAVGPESRSTLREPVFVRSAPLPEVDAFAVGDGYFEGWGSELRDGRLFRPDDFETQSVAIVDAPFASLAWPDEDPLGQTIRIGDGAPRAIVGVIAPQVRRLDEPTPPTVFVPRPFQPPASGWRMVVWAPELSADQLVERIAPAAQAIAVGTSVSASPVEFEWVFNRQTGEATFQAPIVTAFGVLAFVLAAIGVFGLVSYLVAQRSREFGIRLALGARRHDIWRGVFRESIAPAGLGLAVGIAAASALERTVRASVFGWESSGVAALLVVTAALLFVAVIAAIGPARRVLRIDPAMVLRSE
jgi:predicted permease